MTGWVLGSLFGVCETEKELGLDAGPKGGERCLLESPSGGTLSDSSAEIMACSILCVPILRRLLRVMGCSSPCLSFITYKLQILQRCQ